MSLMPEFEFGIWNAWILVVILFAAAFAPLIFGNEKAEKRMEGEPTGKELRKETRMVHIITHMIIMPLTLIISILTPLKIGSWWFYCGLLLYIFGFVFGLLSSIAFATAPLGVPLTKGIYAFSRNPMYVGFFLACAGIGIASASWIYLLCALVWIVAWHFGVIEEEDIMLEKYGGAYQQYMDRTPRWIGLPKNS